MKKHLQRITALMLMFSLSACSSAYKDLTAPCPNYGRHCSQIPINC